MKKIGIIGGNGVAATNKLLQLLEENITKNGGFRDMHHPEIIVYQATQVPSRSMFIEGRGESFIEDYINIAKKLKEIGCEILCICCNTAHYAIDEIKNNVDIEFIDMVEEVVLKVKNTGAKNIGLMASDGSILGEVYSKYFKRIYPQANIIYPNSEMQKDVTRGICNIKNSSRFLNDNSPQRPKNIFQNVEKHLINKGADIIIVGCTDIRVDFKSDNSIDSLEALAEKILTKI